MRERTSQPGPGALRAILGARGAVRFVPGFLEHVARRHGDVARLGSGPVRMLLLSSPELAQELLVDKDHLYEKGRGERRFTQRLLDRGVLGSEGEFHRRQHELIEPLVHGPALDPYVRTVVEHGRRMQEGWSDGTEVELFDLLAEATMDIMIEVLFGAAPEHAESEEIEGALTDAVEALEDLPLPVLPGVEDLPLPGNRRFDRARGRLDAMMASMVRKRRTTRGAGGSRDLLGSLARARHPHGEAMDDELVRDEALSLFRGHKTTGTALSWTWYLLSRHRGVEAAVLREIDTVVGDGGPSAETLPRLRLCRMVFMESMRLFPPAWILSRRATEDHDIGGYRVPEGTTVVTSPYVIHRDPRVHPDPRRFDPTRFDPERRAAWHPFAYFPFGGGPKMCLGDEFASLEGVLLMATVGARWRVRLAPGHRVEPAPKATLKPRFGMRVVLERR